MSGDAPVSKERPSGLTVRLTWIMLFRSVMVAALLLSTVAIRIGTEEEIFGASSIVVFSAAAATYAAILAGALWLNRRPDGSAFWVAHTQLSWDAGLATVLCLSTGGVESGFAFLYFVNVLIAAGLLGRTAAIVVAAQSAALNLGLMVVEMAGLVAPFGGPTNPRLATLVTPLLSNVLGMFLIAILAGYLTEQLLRTSESLTVARQSLVRLEELYAAVLRSLPSGVLTVDDKGSVVYVNEAGAGILGARPQALIGKPVQDVASALPIDAPAGAGNRERFEVQLAEDGDGRVLGGSVARLTGVEQLAGRVVVFQDLTELRRLQRDVARADRLATLGRFSAGLAHEIRNPLAAMVGCLDLLEKDLKTPASERGSGSESESGRMLAIVQREADRLSNLVTAFLTYARPHAPRLEPTPLGELVSDTLTAMEQAEPEVLFEHEFTDDDTASCDPEQIRQVVWNLVNNAVQATTPGDTEPAKERRVRVVVSTDQEYAVVAVEDTGPGVPEDSRVNIFEPFVTTRPQGTGLGLATCYQIIDAHGGRMRVEQSATLGGARFEVRLRRDGAAARTSPPSDTGLPVISGATARAPGAAG